MATSSAITSDYAEPISKVPSHRALAVFRGWLAEVLTVKLVAAHARDRAAPDSLTVCEGMVASQVQWSHQARAADDWLKRAVSWTWKVKLAPRWSATCRAPAESAEEVAIKVFGDNVRDLLLE